MKLLIYIDDSDYKRIKDLVAKDTRYTTATTVGTAYQVIANGTPVSTDGDSIRREALKEAINDLFRTGEYDCNSVLKAIDNAPSVSPYKAIHDELHKGEEEE